jgi:AraC-like DNA-binding protein
MNKGILKEVTSLLTTDCYTILTRSKTKFDFPLHYHEEYELNFIMNANGAKRIVGDAIEIIDDLELILVGPNQIHAWFTHECKSEKITEITLHWHRQLLDENFLSRNQMHQLNKMLENSVRGIVFSKETIQNIMPRLISLKQKTGFASVIEFLDILHELSLSQHMRTLSDSSFNNNVTFNYSSRRTDRVFEYMNKHYADQITLKEMAKISNMTEASFSRFIRKNTGSTFIDSLTDIRLGHACRMLIDTTHSISEISYQCGFSNISNFNRLFKRKKNCTPKEFRNNYSGSKMFV